MAESHNEETMNSRKADIEYLIEKIDELMAKERGEAPVIAIGGGPPVFQGTEFVDAAKEAKTKLVALYKICIDAIRDEQQKKYDN